MQSLNKRYLNHNYVTDVIAFDLSSGPSKVAGDIFVCPEVAARNSAIFGTAVQEELFLYVVHGILHLLGYDDHEEKDIRKMRRKEAEIIRMLGEKVKNIL